MTTQPLLLRLSLPSGRLVDLYFEKEWKLLPALIEVDKDFVIDRYCTQYGEKIDLDYFKTTNSTDYEDLCSILNRVKNDFYHFNDTISPIIEKTKEIQKISAEREELAKEIRFTSILKQAFLSKKTITPTLIFVLGCLSAITSLNDLSAIDLKFLAAKVFLAWMLLFSVQLSSVLRSLKARHDELSQRLKELKD